MNFADETHYKKATKILVATMAVIASLIIVGTCIPILGTIFFVAFGLLLILTAIVAIFMALRMVLADILANWEEEEVELKLSKLFGEKIVNFILNKKNDDDA